MLKKILLIFTAVFVLPPGLFALDQPFDHSLFDQFLKKYVNEAGNVDYAAAHKDPSLLDQYLSQIKAVDEKDYFKTWPREEKIALAINAYHAGLIKKILEHYPLKSVQKIPGFWQMESTVLCGRKKFSLNGLREKHLMQGFRDAKIQTVLSYGAKGGPRLSRDAFTGPKLEAQLFMAARRFVNDAEKNRIRPGKRKIHLSKIFEWHNADFNLNFGAFENEKGLSQRDYAVLSFIANYLEDEAKIKYLEDGGYKIKYLNFDWSLNDASLPASS